jgi:two-component system sensor histidine kinase BaeS
MHSITYRITGLVFLLLAVTVLSLTYLVDWQMTNLFHTYVMGGHHMSRMYGGTMGMPEQAFLSSVHQTLIWVGFGILLIGLFASYIFARSITVPLRTLSLAVEGIEKGNYGKKVYLEAEDEIGHLATAFNKMTEKLETNTKLRQRLLADIAHELRTPLAVIQGHLEGMLEGVIELDKEQIGSLYDETVQLSRLVKDLRDLTLAEAGQLTLDKKPADMNQLIVRVLQMLKPLADEKQISLESEMGSLPVLTVDTVRINQVLYNLLTNALRYTPEKGTIQVVADAAMIKGQEFVQIEIRDSGTGIAEEDLPYVFNHFYRADQSRNRKSGGSGIGLAIVKQLVEIHGGFVDVKSKPNSGSTFFVYLPIKE